jgi:large subunit ribosomal protein L13
MKIYDGKGMVLGRLATKVAKDLLLGEVVKVVNSEKVIISGKKEAVFAKEKQKMDRRGYPLKSAKYSRMPDRFVRRTVRGMLPWKQARGKEAFKRVMCYIGVPEVLTKEKLIRVAVADAEKLPSLNYVTVGEVCKKLGGKQ